MRNAGYRRTDLFERRHRLMEDWEAYLLGKRDGIWRPS